MVFLTYCFKCLKEVSAMTTLDKDELWKALDSNAEIEVMHTAEDGDHRWNLNHYEKENLRGKRPGGSI
jgi:hypothetical protein